MKNSMDHTKSSRCLLEHHNVVFKWVSTTVGIKFKEETNIFCRIKVDVPSPVTIVNHAPIFEWYVV